MKKSTTQAVYTETSFFNKTKETLENQQVDPLIGRTLNQRYLLEARLGSGGMGAVYRAKRLQIGDIAAVKVLNPDHSADSRSVERFYREAQIGASLRHPNAVTVYDFGVDGGKLIYFVMELVEGKNLRSIIMQNGRLHHTEAVEILIQVCEVLDEAHRHHVIHRDLKPENILVHDTPNGRQVKVFDFGIAALRTFPADKLTQTGSVIGTPHYMSPEQCMGAEVDGRSDIYSLGIILYEMLAGAAPFDSKTPTAIAVQQVNRTPPSLRELNPDVPPQVEAVVMRALKKRPEERPQTAAAFAQELLAAVQNHPAIAIGQNAEVEQAPSSEASPTTRKGSALLLLAASLILLLVVAAGFRPARYFKNDVNVQQSIAPVVKEPVVNDPAVKENDQAPAPQSETDQPAEPAPAPSETPAPIIKTKPAPPPVRKNAEETQKRLATNRKPAPQKAVVPAREAREAREVSEYNPDRRMSDNFDRSERYRRYRYNPYWPGYRERFYMRRRFRWDYR